jgi:capsular polysaccharide biosynthesis protein
LRLNIAQKTKKMLARFLVALPISSRYLGPPKGVHDCALDVLKGPGANLGEIIVERQLLEYITPPKRSLLNNICHFEERRDCMKPYAATFPKGRIYGKDGTVILPDDRVALDSLPAYYVVKKHSNAGGLRVLRKLKMPPLRKIDGHVVNLSLGDTQNYSHWTFQNMTRLQLLKAAGIEADYYYVDVSQTFQREYLEIMGIPFKKVIPAERKAHLEANLLTMVSGCSWNQVPYPDLLTAVRESVWAVLGTNPVEAKRRIYISRADASYRKVYNEEEVMAYLGPLGFERVTMTDLSVIDQARLHQQAAVVIGPHGANMTNIIFCQPGTYVLEIFQPGWVDPGYIAPSAQLGLRYFYTLGEVSGQKMVDKQRAWEQQLTETGCHFNVQGYYIKLDQLKRFIKIVENGA